jgi:7,8-dihydropterin-6-yl-methyl-4-(beta-D-ribofuranosyl)aminobenzene 5'-phosphate synthase
VLRAWCIALLLAVTLWTDGVAQSTRITILFDAFGARSDLKKDWGYAALVEHQGQRILFDTGNDSELLRHNAEVLGVDLRNLDLVVVSHRHGDHTDGLRYLLSINPDVPVLAANDEYFGGPTPRSFFDNSVDSLPAHMRYFDGHVPPALPHGTPWKQVNVQRVPSELEIAPGIKVVGNISRGGGFTETPELALVLQSPQGQIVLVGCSHPGIENILASIQAQTRPVRLLIGGLHWLTLPQAEVERLSHALRTRWNVQSVAPGHCSGEFAFSILSSVYGNRYVYAGLGTTIEL